MTATRIAVVIPFFQRKPGLLAAALASVATQEGLVDVTVDIIIVDDGSPVPASSEHQPALPAHWSLRIIEQTNTGVGGARNKALDSVASNTRYVAFLDSDDVWLPGHLGSALACLENGADFYFDNNLLDKNVNCFEQLKYMNSQLKINNYFEKSYHFVHAMDFFMHMLSECIPHTSQVVYNFAKFRFLKFDTSFKMAGEDQLFWLQIVYRCKFVAYDTRIFGIREKGVSIHQSTYDWNSKNILSRILDQLLMHKKIKELFYSDKKFLAITDTQIKQKIGEFVFIAARMSFRRPMVVVHALKRIATEFPAALLSVPSALFHIRRHRNELLAPLPGYIEATKRESKSEP